MQTTTHRKKVAVFFRLPESMDTPLSKPAHWEAYSQLTDLVSAEGGDLYIVRGQSTYLGSGRFTKSWRIMDNQLVDTGELQTEAIFNKGRFQSDNTVPVFNYEKVSQICTDKWLMYEKFSRFCPKTFLAHTQAELTEFIGNIDTEQVVCKPVAGGEGKGVIIEEKAYFLRGDTALEYPVVVQEFMDTSVGIPGIMRGMHDLRIIIFDGDIIGAFYRTPPQGSFLANVSLGGDICFLDIKTLPAEVLQVVREVDAELSDCDHRFYSIDLGCTAQGPRIIEMNSEIGLFGDDYNIIYKHIKERIAKVLMML